MTTWSKIPGIPQRFEASHDGQIRTLDYETAHTSRSGNQYMRRIKGRVLKPRINKGTPSMGKHPIVGIYQGTCRKDGQNREYRVARLVAAAFHGVPYDVTDFSAAQLWRIRFRDDDVLNCGADNLEWVHRAGPENQARYDLMVAAWERRDDASTVLSRLFDEDAA